MKILSLTAALSAALLAALHSTAQQPTPLLTQQPAQLIETLRSAASQKEKIDACRQLSVIGGKDAVPALAALLPDPSLSHMARYALETIPDPAAGAALREALSTLEGRLLAGVAGSAGVRRDKDAVPRLAQLLQNPDADVRDAAARALGNIANPAAVDALAARFRTASPAAQPALGEGLLRAAEHLGETGDRARAAALYHDLQQFSRHAYIRWGALRGAILVQGQDGIGLLRESLRANDYAVFATAVQVAYEAPRREVTEVLAGELPRLSEEDRKVMVIQALAKRSDAAGLPALSQAASTGSQTVRLAAIRALAEAGHPSSTAKLTELLGGSDREISAAALEALAVLPGESVDAAILSLLESRDSSRQVASVELIARRRMSGCVPRLLKAAGEGSDAVRPAALAAIGELGGAGEIPGVLQVLAGLKQAADLDAAEQALSSLGAKAPNPESCTDALTANLAQLSAPQKSALLRVLSSVGGSKALQTVRAAVNDSNPEVHAAAIRALGAWKTVDAAPALLILARSASNPTDQTLSLRSYLGLASNADVPARERLALCKDALPVVKGSEDKKLLLSALASIDSADAAAMAVPYLEEAATREEAAAAITSIAERMVKGQRQGRVAAGIIESLEKVATSSASEAMSKRAQSLLEQARKRAGQP